MVENTLFLLPFALSYLEDKPDWSYGIPDRVFDLPWRLSPGCTQIPVLCLLRKGGGKIAYLTPRRSGKVDLIRIYRFHPDSNRLEQLKFSDGEGNVYSEYRGDHQGDWHKIFYLRREMFSDAEGEKLYIKVKFDDEFIISPKDERETFYASVLLADKPLPKLTGWLVGDGHIHTELTNNSSEYGPPLEIFLYGRDWFGLDYIILTDHGFDLKETDWIRLRRFARDNSKEDFSILIGEEVHAKNDNNWLPSLVRCHSMHILGYNLRRRIKSGSTIFHSYNPSKDENEVMAELVSRSDGGFCYIAHPRAEREGRWNYELRRLKDGWLGSPIVGLEILNGGDFREKKNKEAVKLLTTLLLQGKRLWVMGNSDSHSLRLGMGRTYIKAKENSRKEILTALKSGMTVATNGPFGYMEATNERDEKAGLGEDLKGKEFKFTLRWDADPKHQYTDISLIRVYRGKVGEDREREIPLPGVDYNKGSFTTRVRNLEPGSYYTRAEFLTSEERRAVTSSIFLEVE